MIQKLQRRFIRIALLVLTLAMILVLAVVNLSNWLSVRRELLHTVSLISASTLDGESPLPPEEKAEEPAPSDALPSVSPGTSNERSRSSGNGEGIRRSPLPDDLADLYRDSRQQLRGDRHARNLINESSWFSLLETGEDTLTLQSAAHVTDLGLTEEEMQALALRALQSGSECGFVQEYAFQIRTLPAGRLVCLLNCETRFAAVRTLLLISGLASLGGILLAWLLVTLFSRKAVEPTLRNMEQQKRFITDASHELKTPLTVISTNMELLQMELPENQWIRSTQKQTGILRKLVDELVYLSRMEEENPTLTLEPLPLQELIPEAAEPFQAMAEYQGREMTLEVEANLTVIGDRSSIQRLISTLCDNAVKYASGEGPIRITARGEGKHAILEISNPVSEPLSREQCDHLFDRFYRADPSRSKGKHSGFGIGLAIAAAIVEKHGGRISAAISSADRFMFTCLLPRVAGSRKGGDGT